MSEIKIGTKLKAINKCIMEDTKKPSLTIGKNYEVKLIDYVFNETHVTIDSDTVKNHIFPMNGIWDFFEVKVSKNPK